MAGPRPERPPGLPDDVDTLAGNYVLGALDAEAMREVRAEARVNPLMDTAIAQWERRLTPLVAVIAPVEPPDALWQRLERSIAPDEVDASAAPLRAERRPVTSVTPLVPRRRPPPRRAAPSPPQARGRTLPWQLATVGSLALAACFAALLFRPDLVASWRAAAPLPPVAALLPADSRAPGFLAEARPDGAVVLTALAPVSVPAGHDLELWILRPGEAAPSPLGVLPAAGRRVTLPAMPPDGTQMMISLEPPGGSPSGRPTGPVLYAGAFVRRGA